MVELGNHQGRPPGCNPNQSIEMNTHENNQPTFLTVPSLMEPWMNMDITNLENAAELMGSNTTSRDGFEPGTYLGSKEILGLLNSQELQDFERTLELDASSNILLPDSVSHKCMYQSAGDQDQMNTPPYTYTIWGAPMDVDSLKIDDIFQVDEDDLIQGPTLAELNANDEPFFDLAFDDFVTSKSTLSVSSTAVSQSKLSSSFDGVRNRSETSSPVVVKKELPTLSQALSVPAVTKVVKQTDQQQQQASGVKPLAETFIKQEQLGSGQHRKPILLGTLLGMRHRTRSESGGDASTVATAASTSTSSLEKSQSIQIPSLPARHRNDSNTTDVSLCSLSSLSSLSNDEGFGSQAEDSDADDRLTSDDESQNSDCPEIKFESSKISKNVRKKKYFWQYNIQSKGPKGPRIAMNTSSVDPHVLNDVLDPVFSSECALEGVKHAGKARKGDGNDLTPNPRKLHSIGMELRSLNKMINDLAPVTNVPFNARPKTRKEKNKLASRACRLKKKAQHEANKLKLYGLQQEHKKLMHLVSDVKNVVKNHISDEISPSESCTNRLEELVKMGGEFTVAGHTAEYVNKVLDKVAQGQSNGGLHDI